MNEFNTTSTFSLFIFCPSWSMRHCRQKDFHFAFIGLKTATLSGCKICVTFGNKATRIIPFLEQNSLEKCDA